MDSRKSNIFELLNGSKQFSIPIYQRHYNWGTKQCARLWNDIVEMQKNNRKDHFIGCIVNLVQSAMPAGIQKFTIVDGQQRMTTLLLLLIALRDYCIKNSDDTAVDPRRIDSEILKNEYASGDERYKLLLTDVV